MLQISMNVVPVMEIVQKRALILLAAIFAHAHWATSGILTAKHVLVSRDFFGSCCDGYMHL